MKERSVIVHPPVKHEGRKAEVHGVLVGRARGLRDVIEVLRGVRVGKGWDEGDVAGLPATLKCGQRAADLRPGGALCRRADGPVRVRPAGIMHRLAGCASCWTSSVRMSRTAFRCATSDPSGHSDGGLRMLEGWWSLPRPHWTEGRWMDRGVLLLRGDGSLRPEIAPAPGVVQGPVGLAVREIVDRGEALRVVVDAGQQLVDRERSAFRRRLAGQRDAIQRACLTAVTGRPMSLASRVRDCSTGQAVSATGPLRGPIGSISRARSPIVNWACVSCSAALRNSATICS